MKAWLVFLLVLVSSCSHAPRNSRQDNYLPRTRVQEDQAVAWNEPPVKRVNRGLIIIDPGHGGEDDGTKSKIKPIYLEKYLNLTTAKFLSSYLEQLGYQTLMTRSDDTFIPLKARAEFANERRPMLFVSVHFNSAPSAEAKGIEIFYFKSIENQTRTVSSKSLATAILNEMVRSTSAPSRGVKHGNYAVIRETQMPAVLVEGGFLTNSEELEKIKDPNYLKKVAWGIAQGVNKFVLGSILK